MAERETGGSGHPEYTDKPEETHLMLTEKSTAIIDFGSEIEGFRVFTFHRYGKITDFSRRLPARAMLIRMNPFVSQSTQPNPEHQSRFEFWLC